MPTTRADVSRASYIVLTLAAWLLASSAGFANEVAVTGLHKPDVRVLIERSSSMATSDPQNLRAAGLDLLTRILPDGARAGVWGFDESVAVLVPHGTVDDEWRQRAQEAIKRIDNEGELSNIPAALAAATATIDEMGPEYQTNIIVLMDGDMEVSPSPIVSAAAGNLLLKEAARLGERGVPVHTIALSRDADWSLLRALSRVTGGIAEWVKDPGDLLEAFMQALEVVAPATRLPLDRNRFRINASDSGLSVLVFFNGARKQLGLIGPDGKEYPLAEEAESIEGIDWFISDQFALVKMVSPDPGNWELKAPRAATARVTVDSDLDLLLDPIQNSYLAGSEQELSFRITRGDGVLTDPALLAGIDIALLITHPDGEVTRSDFAAGVLTSSEGRFNIPLPVMDTPGRYRVLVRLNAQTVQLELPLLLDLLAPADQATLVTRKFEPVDDEFRMPLIALGTGAVAAILVIAWILRRRKRRKLEIWQRRSRELSARQTGQYSRATDQNSEEGRPAPLD